MQGKCLCGAVSYVCKLAPVVQVLCHCRDCQMASGSAFAAIAFFSEQSLLISGEVKYYESVGSSGKRIWRGFCPNCGSNLFSRAEKAPGLVSIRAGTLTDPTLFQPQLQIYTAEALNWATLTHELPAFTGDFVAKGRA